MMLENMCNDVQSCQVFMEYLELFVADSSLGADRSVAWSGSCLFLKFLSLRRRNRHRRRPFTLLSELGSVVVEEDRHRHQNDSNTTEQCACPLYVHVDKHLAIEQWAAKALAFLQQSMNQVSLTKPPQKEI
jgi:hypothetical protein